jgi:hypothetical protein
LLNRWLQLDRRRQFHASRIDDRHRSYPRAVFLSGWFVVRRGA